MEIMDNDNYVLTDKDGTFIMMTGVKGDSRTFLRRFVMIRHR